MCSADVVLQLKTASQCVSVCSLQCVLTWFDLETAGHLQFSNNSLSLQQSPLFTRNHLLHHSSPPFAQIGLGHMEKINSENLLMLWQYCGVDDDDENIYTMGFLIINRTHDTVLSWYLNHNIFFCYIAICWVLPNNILWYPTANYFPKEKLCQHQFYLIRSSLQSGHLTYIIFIAGKGDAKQTDWPTPS